MHKHNITALETAIETPETPVNSTIALGQSAIVTRKRAIVAAGAIALIALVIFAPTAAGGLLFGGGLFAVNSMIDSKMGGE